MMVLAVVVATTVSLTIGFQRTNAANTSRQDQIDVARTAVERMSKTVRTAVKPSQLSTCTGCTADAFLSAGDFSVQFYANLDNSGNITGPSRISYSIATTGVDAAVLIEKAQVPDANPPTGSGYVYCDAEATGANAACKARLVTHRLAAGVSAVTGAPVFKYYDTAGTRMIPAAGASLTAAQMTTLLAVEVAVSVRSPGATAVGPTTYVQRITMPNSQAVFRLNEVPTS